MAKVKTEKAKAGVWFPIGSKWHREVCCDCGLVHKVEIGVNMEAQTGKSPSVRIFQRGWRDDRMTARLRKQRNGKKNDFACKPRRED
jgi:hypothetical protein